MERTNELAAGVAPDFTATEGEFLLVEPTPGGSEIFSCAVSDGQITLGPIDWLVPPGVESMGPADSSELLAEVAAKTGQPIPPE